MFEEAKLRAADTLKLPKDVVLGEMVISCLGRHSVVVENYRSILFYTDAMVKLQGKNCRLNIAGSRLTIEYYTSEEMKIAGQIRSIEFE